MNRFSDGNAQVQDNFLKYYLLSQQQQQQNNPMIEDLRNKVNEFQQKNNKNFMAAGNYLTYLSNRFDDKPFNIDDSEGVGITSLDDDDFISQKNVEDNDDNEEQTRFTTTIEKRPQFRQPFTSDDIDESNKGFETADLERENIQPEPEPENIQQEPEEEETQQQPERLPSKAQLSRNQQKKKIKLQQQEDDQTKNK